jgi:hypothetical protein
MRAAFPDQTELRMALSDDDALSIAATIAEADAKQPAHLAAALAELELIRQEGEPEGFAARAAQGERAHKAIGRFWEAFEGQMVEGVELVRRR